MTQRKRGKGSKCPICGKQTFHDKGSFDECSRCGFIGWSWKKGVSSVGKGKGYKCPNCTNQTFHEVKVLDNDHLIRRCGTCDYSGIVPPGHERQEREEDLTVL